VTHWPFLPLPRYSCTSTCHNTQGVSKIGLRIRLPPARPIAFTWPLFGRAAIGSIGMRRNWTICLSGANRTYPKAANTNNRTSGKKSTVSSTDQIVTVAYDTTEHIKCSIVGSMGGYDRLRGRLEIAVYY